jgi:HEAT repeat protein
VRHRVERKIRKRLRLTRHNQPLVAELHQHERSGVPLVHALRLIMLDSRADWYTRGTAARLLGLAGTPGAVRNLLDLFFAQSGKDELWQTALTVERAGGRAAVRRLVDALNDSNPHRRCAAARALGWIPHAGKRAAKALILALLDKSQPQPVREQVAESLAYSNYSEAIPPLISVLSEPDPGVRFWAVFALGTLGRWRKWAPGAGGRWPGRVIDALEPLLSDEESPSGNWWAVGKEALAMLGSFDPRYRAELDRETQRLLRDPNSSPENSRWAEGYCRAR